MDLRWRFAQFFELLWWKNYLSKRDKTAYLDWKKAYWKAFLKHSGGVLPAPGALVLDAGCGPAGIFVLLHERYRVDALDPLIDRYQASLDHFDPGDYPGVRFLTGALETFVPDRQYDLVCCLNAINHVADLHRSLQNLLGCIRPGGTLLLSVDAHRNRWLKRLFQWLPGDILHPQQFDLSDYQQLIRQHGGTVLRTVLIRESPIFNYCLLVVALSD